MSKKYRCMYCNESFERKELIEHIENDHSDMIPKNYSAARLVYNQINKRTHGICMICKKETKWDENKQRYDSLCGSKKCHDEYVKMVRTRMVRKYGTETLLNNPEHQKKMLANRSISGYYKFKDGGKIGYVGSYEKRFLEFLDVFLNVKSSDILSPGPTILYHYKGKDHFWVTDFLYEPYNLVFDVKDGGSNPNTREMKEYREKQKAKELAIKEQGEYNYIRLTDNNFEQLIEVFLLLKEQDSLTKPLVKINEVAKFDGGNSSKPFYFYHIIDKNADTVYSLDWFYKNNKPLFKKYSDKYRDRLCDANAWNVYPGVDPDSLSLKEVYDGINQFRKSKHGCEQIYLFRFPPYRDLDFYFNDLYKTKKIFRIDLNNPRIQNILVDVDYGWDKSNTDNDKLSKSYYDNISKTEYFDSYEEDNSMKFASLNHISIIVKGGKIPKNLLEEVPIPKSIQDIHEEYRDKDINYQQIYHISTVNHDGEVFEPRVYDNDNVKKGMERRVKRICFSDSIEGAYYSIFPNGTYDIDLYVHVPATDVKIYRTTTDDIYDSDITHEIWVKEPVEMKCIGKIHISGTTQKYKTIDVDAEKSGYGKRKYFKPRYSWVEKYDIEPVTESTVSKKQIDDMKVVIKSLDKNDFNDFTASKKYNYIKIHYDNGKPVGFCATRDVRERLNGVVNKVCMISIAVSPEYRRKGIASSLARDAISHAKKDKDLFRIYWGLSINNTASEELAKKLGFKFDYESKEHDIRVYYIPLTKETITEGFIFNKKDLYINYESFESGKSNVLLVTGLSGSGKTTLASKIAKENNAELIELDCFECCYQFTTDEQLKQAGQVFYDYLFSHKQLWDNLKERKVKGKELSTEIDKFIKYCIPYCKRDKSNKYVIEGVQIYGFLEKESLGNIPIIMTGASALTSIARRLKRAKDNSIQDLKNQLSELPQCIAWYIDEENAYKKFIKAITESTSENSLYHVSEVNLDGKTLMPKVPNNYLVKNSYEDNTTKRVCFPVV